MLLQWWRHLLDAEAMFDQLDGFRVSRRYDATADNCPGLGGLFDLEDGVASVSDLKTRKWKT